jgi:ankyrin repeat protein
VIGERERNGVFASCLNNGIFQNFLLSISDHKLCNVVKALQEVGGRGLAMMTKDDGASYLWISAHEGHLDVVNALLEVGGRELAMMTRDGCASW